jgi:hypothetical protein
MKVNITFDCTPEEARAFFGLPDVRPLQEAMMSELRGRVDEGFKAMEPAELLRMMLNQYAGGLEQMQSFLGRVGWTPPAPKKG